MLEEDDQRFFDEIARPNCPLSSQVSQQVSKRSIGKNVKDSPRSEMPCLTTSIPTARANWSLLFRTMRSWQLLFSVLQF